MISPELPFRFKTLFFFGSVAAILLASLMLMFPSSAPATVRLAVADKITGVGDNGIRVDDGTPLDDGVYRYDPDEPIRQMLHEIRNDLAGDLTRRERVRLLSLAARLEASLGNFRQATKDIKALFEIGVLTDKEKVENYYFLGVVLAMQEKYQEALPHAQEAIDLAKEPKEEHYRLLLFCYIKLEQFGDQLALLERMTKLFPGKDQYVKLLEKGRRKMKQPAN